MGILFQRSLKHISDPDNVPLALFQSLASREGKRVLQCPEGEIKFPVSRWKGLYRKGPSNCSIRETLAHSPGNLHSGRIAWGIKNSYLGTKSFRSSMCQKQNLPSCVQSAQVQKCCFLRKVGFFTDKVLNLTNLTFWINIHCRAIHLWKRNKKEINTASSIF